MRAEVVSGYDWRERDKENQECPHEYPFVLIKIITEPTSGDERRVASYIEYNGMSDRESRLFVERSPPGMDWMEKVFKLIRETESRGIISGGLHEIRVDCEDEIEILTDRPGLVDHEGGKVYFADGGYGDVEDLDEWNNKR